MKSPILYFFILCTCATVFSQKNEIEVSSWTVGTGVSNFAMHGDLTSDAPNLGFYLYLNKMITPAFGFELKGQILNTEGNSQDTFTTLPEYNANNLRFEGETFGGDANLVINLSALNTNEFINRKFNVNSYFGIGYHTYSAKLYNDDTNELIEDFVANKRGSGSKSIYYTSGIGLKYRLSERLDLELRQNVNFNNEDHLDAAVSTKQHLETFFTTQLGLVFKLHKKERQIDKIEDNTVTEKNSILEKSITKLVDSDQDGVIDQFDKEPNTEKGAFVYSNGVTIDSDKDGVPDHKDKCPLVKGDNKVGCLGNDKLETLATEKTEVAKEIIPAKVTVKKPVVKEVAPIKIEKPIIKIIDSDNDGFPDNKDNCPQVFSKTNNGCPKKIIPVKIEIKKPIIKEVAPIKIEKPIIKIIDSDNDGFPDNKDNCPQVFSKTNNGCPEKIIPVKVVVKKPIIKEIEKPIADENLSDYDKEKAMIDAIIAGSRKQNTETNDDIVVTVFKTKKTESENSSESILKNNPNIELIKELNKDNIKHNIYELDNSVNHLNIEVSPIYPGCENQLNNIDKENCMITKLSIFALKNFDSSNLSNINLGLSTNLMRVIFVVDENGKSKVYKAVTNWQPEVIQEMKRVIESLPTMKPGLLKNIPTPVKYSVEVPFKANN